MDNYIFYSWQSDLPNSNNRTFLEQCINTALKELAIENKYNIEFRIDKDTMNETGTPHIADTIFTKIRHAQLFIADISIINKDSTGRKTPNPNVLLELGYAARSLGWNRIICVYNTDYGDFDDLPFDLKFRRPLCYSVINNTKAIEKRKICEIIKENIHKMDVNELPVPLDVSSYLVLESSTFYNQFEKMFKNAISKKEIQEEFKFEIESCHLEVYDDLDFRIDNDEPHNEKDIEYTISITFLDDGYSFNGVDNRECSLTYSFVEKFKQINFENNKVYSVFELVSRGNSPITNKRDYGKLSISILKKIESK